MSKLCLIFNTAPLYRTSIYCRIDEQYDCKWVFGPKRSDIKEMDFSLLKDVSFYSLMGNANRFSIKRGMLKYLFKREYQTYLMYPETHSLTDWLFFWLAFNFFKKKCIYLWTHGWYGKESKIQSLMKQWLFKHATGIFSYSNYARDLMIERGIPANNIFTIHNSLDYERQIALRKEQRPSNIYQSHFGNNNPVIIFIGRLTKVKQLDILVEAGFRLAQQGESYNLVFVGGGEEADNLRAMVEDKKLDGQVWFYGPCYDEKINSELIYNADLCVAPGNVGLTAVHTMMFGTPVITHNSFEWQMPEFEAIQEGVTGAFFERGNMQSLAEQIEQWFVEKKDKRDEVRQSCYQLIDTSWNPYYQLEVLKKVIH